MTRPRFRFRFSFLLVSLWMAGCATDPSSDQVAVGEWGGVNVDLQVSASGATAQFKCGALGAIDGPIALDNAQHFDVSGTYDPKLVLGGPRSARFTGTVNGTRMTLTVEVEGQPIGTFELTFGSPGSFEACNF